MSGQPFEISAAIDHLIDPRLEKKDREEGGDQDLEKKERPEGRMKRGHERTV
jgi:hypothetical protein